MALLGAEVVRFGVSGFSQIPYGSFSGKATAPPVFSGTIADISESVNTGSQVFDLSTYFTGATSYSISPAVETGWTFNTSTGVLTIETDTVGDFGPYTVTGTNAGGSDNSNAFNVTITAIPDVSATGGFWFDYDREYIRRKAKQEELEEARRKAKLLQNAIDREIAELLQAEEKEKARLEELKRLSELANKHQRTVTFELGQNVAKAAQRAQKQGNFSAMEALERNLRIAKEEEEFLFQALTLIINQ